MQLSPLVPFYNSHTAPQLGFGVWQIPNDQTASSVQTALETGYRLIDTAAIYENEQGVGAGLAASGLARDDYFVTTKVWNDSHGQTATRSAFFQSLERLNLDYVDMYLIHWPVPKYNLFIETWETLIQLRDEGLIKNIGVCNFNANHIESLIKETGEKPVVNQIELHPGFQQHAMRAFNANHQIQTQAWSPMGLGTLWDNPTLTEIAQKHQRNVGQIMLRWQLEQGNMVISKSISPERIRSNFDVFSFSLDANDMAAIAQLDQTEGRLGPDPELFRLPK